MARDSSDSGGIVTGWLVKVVISIVLFGVVAFDAVAIGVAHLSVVDDADTAAQAAGSAWRDAQGTKNARELAYQAAVAVADRHGETVEPDSFSVSPDGTVHVTLRRVASTVVIRHISPLRGLSVATGSGSATPPLT